VFSTLTVLEVVPMLPAASTARTARECCPLLTPLVLHDHDQEAVPAAEVQAPPSIDTCTVVTPTSSVVVPVTLVVPETVLPAAGVLIVTVGAPVSAGAATVTRRLDVAVFPAVSVARATRTCSPAASP
jgi:hypothetical protein